MSMFKNSPSGQCNWSFRRFWVFCADELGSARLQVEPKAANLDQFCGNSQFALTPLKAVLRASYKRSRCKNLDSSIKLDALLDVLGEAAFTLHGQSKDDLLDIELLEEVGWCVNAIYTKRADRSANDQATAKPHDVTPSSPASIRKSPLGNNARVVSLKSAKQRRANVRG